MVAAALLGASSAQALTLQSVGSFDQPTYVTSDPGDANRLFVVERTGTIKLVENGVRSVFTDLSPKVECGVSCSGERGLLSIALSPGFGKDGRLFVDYANNVDGTIHIEELVSEDPGHDSADISTLRPLAAIPHPDESNHNGGQLQFGRDGNLYVSTGDGGGSNDEFHNAQDPSSPLGKILQIDPDLDPAPAPTVWSSGLRNPYRFSFDRLTGDMVIGDVGEGAREEIDFAPSPAAKVVGGSGANYGWNCREGIIAGPGTDPGCLTLLPADFVDPVFDYPHTPDPDLGGSKRCAIIGGYVARDPSLGALYGRYIYADLCSGAIRSLQLPTTVPGRAGEDCSLGLRVDQPVSFGEDAARRLYVVGQGGQISRLSGLPPATCPPPAPQPLPSLGLKEAEPTFVGIKAERRRVERGKRALLTVFVSPCQGRKGHSVQLLRNGRPNGTRALSRACTARFLPRVRSGTTFAATTRSDREYVAGKSRKLTIRLAHPKHNR